MSLELARQTRKCECRQPGAGSRVSTVKPTECRSTAHPNGHSVASDRISNQEIRYDQEKRKRRSAWQSIWSVRHHPRTDHFGCQTPPDRRSPSLTQGRYYSPKSGCQTRRVGFLDHFLSACCDQPESSRILPVRLFPYEIHDARRVKKLWIKDRPPRLDSRH